MGAYLSWDSEFLYFDVTTDLTHTLNSSITEHPVEKGSDITDNARPNLDVVSFEVFVSNAPMGDENTPSFGDLVKTSVPIDPPKFSAPFAPTPGAITNAIGNAISSLLGSDDPVKAQVFMSKGESNYVSQVLNILRSLRDTSQIVKVVTPEFDYDSMLLQSADLNRNAASGTGASIKLVMRQIRIVESKIVNAPIPAVVRAKKAVAKGAQGPVEDPAKKQSVLFQGIYT